MHTILTVIAFNTDIGSIYKAIYSLCKHTHSCLQSSNNARVDQLCNNAATVYVHFMQGNNKRTIAEMCPLHFADKLDIGLGCFASNPRLTTDFVVNNIDAFKHCDLLHLPLDHMRIMEALPTRAHFTHYETRLIPIEFIDKHLYKYDWSRSALASRNDLTPNIQRHISGWDGSSWSVPMWYVRKNPTHAWNPVTLISRCDVSNEDKEYIYFHLMNDVGRRRYATHVASFTSRITEVLEISGGNYDAAGNPYLTIDILRKYRNLTWEWTNVTMNMAININDILANPDLPWDINKLSRYRATSLAMIIDNPQIKWNWRCVSRNLNIPLTTIFDTLAKYPWNADYISRRRDLTYRLILTYPNFNWNFRKMFGSRRD